MSEDVEKELGLVSDMGGAGMRCLSSDDKELSVEYIRQCFRYEEAHAAYVEAAKLFFGEFACAGV